MTVNKPHLTVCAPSYFSNRNLWSGLTRLTVSDNAGGDISFEFKDVSSLDFKSLNLEILQAQADIALIVVDTTYGLGKRDRWVKAMTCLSRIPKLVIAIDNLVHDESAHEQFREISEELADQIGEIDCLEPTIVPVDSTVDAFADEMGGQFDWYQGPDLASTLRNFLTNVKDEEKGIETTLSSDQFAVHLCWSAEVPMLPGRGYRLVHGDQQTDAQISELKYKLNPETMGHLAAKTLLPGDIGYANIALSDTISFLPFDVDRQQGSFWLENKVTGEKVAFGLIKHELRRATNIKWHILEVDKTARATTKGQIPCVLWFTGLSGSGKSTVATIIDKKLHTMGKHTYLLDGDNVRHGLCRDLGFTDADRVENMRRISETAKLFVDAGMIVLVSFISPFRSERAAARAQFDDDEFLEIFVDTPLEECEKRDPKGLYKKARAGQLKNFTGIDSPYEAPEKAEIILPGGASASAADLADQVISEMEKLRLIA